MGKETKVAVFEGKKIRRIWDEKNKVWLFSVVDVVGVLSESSDAGNYWRVLKNRLKNEGSQVITKCNALRLLASDNKYYFTDVTNTETIFRIIQSIPSPKAEPFKLWLARVGYERVEEAEDPEKAISRALNTYLKKGYSPSWVNLRLKSIEVRKGLTDEWQERGVKTSDEFAILTDDITFAWAGLKTKNYKNYKGLKKENLRDNMTNLELILTMLSEEATKEISQAERPQTFPHHRVVAKKGGAVAKVARKEIELQTKKPVISPQKAKGLKLIK